MTTQRMLPLYQGIMGDTFDHRAADVVRSPTAQKRQNQPSYLSNEDKRDPNRLAMPAYWVREELVDDRLADNFTWLLTFRDVTSVTNARTLVPCGVPKAGVGHKTPLVFKSLEALAVYALFSSFVMDYVARQKVGGTSMTYSYVYQFAAPEPSVPLRFSRVTLIDWLRPRVTELVFTANDMHDCAESLGDHGEPFVWGPERRFWLRAELDAAFFHLYGVERDDVDYIMETFPIVKRKDLAAHGSFRTKEAIVSIYDAMAEAIASGTEYETVLSPPPGDGPRHPAQEQES